MRVPLVGRGVSRIQSDGTLELASCGVEIPVVGEPDVAERSVALGQQGIPLHRLQRRLLRLWHDFQRALRIDAGGTQQRVCIGQAGIRGREFRILRDGPLEVVDGAQYPLGRPLVPVRAAVGVIEPRLGIDLPRTGQPLLLAGGHLHSNLFGDGAGGVACERQDVA